jgi:hypothetical protein
VNLQEASYRCVDNVGTIKLYGERSSVKEEVTPALQSFARS